MVITLRGHRIKFCGRASEYGLWKSRLRFLQELRFCLCPTLVPHTRRGTFFVFFCIIVLPEDHSFQVLMTFTWIICWSIFRLMYSNLFFVNRSAMRTERLCCFSWLGHWVGLVTFCINFMGKYGNGGWCRDESAYLTPLWLGFHSQTWNHIMLVRILAPRFFFFYLVLLFSSTNKLNTPNAKKSGNTGDLWWDEVYIGSHRCF